MIIVDGSYGEGGGQILRSALALSVVTQRPIKVVNIRAKRPNPGLQAQHLTGVRVLAEISDAEVEGAYKGSTTLVFRPRTIRCGSFRFDVGTAGAITLVIQAALPALVFAPCPTTLEISGGTDVAWSPPIDYVRLVMLPVLARMGVRASIELIRRGHYPRGGGLVRLRVEPSKLEPMDAESFGRVAKVVGRSHATNLPRHVAERQAESAKRLLAKLGVPIEIEVEQSSGLGPGSGIVVAAESSNGLVMGGDSLGEKGKPAEKVGEEAAQKLLEDLSTGAALDRHMGDMIVTYMALAPGKSSVTVAQVTEHLVTNIHVVKLITGADIELINAKPPKIVKKG